MRIAEALPYFNSSGLSQAEKGAKFERVMRAWFLADPVYSDLLSNVWLWSDFPGCEQFGSHDLGIDLAARTWLGEYWAIQCKFYNDQCEAVKAGKELDRNPKCFSWKRAAEQDLAKGKKYNLGWGRFVTGAYRPFTTSNLYFSRQLTVMVYLVPQLFPTSKTENKIICVSGLGGTKEFTTLMTNTIPDLNILDLGT